MGRSALVRGLIGVRALVGTSVGRRCGRKQRWDAGYSVGRSAPGRGLISLGLSVEMTVFS